VGGETIGVPVALAEFLRQSCGLTCFFETGTAFGDSAAWASERFDQVITVEAAVAMFVISKRKLAAYPKVTGLLGDSRQHIRNLLPSLPPTLFWLDAHYSGTDTHGERDQCPLLGEIEAIAATLDRNAVMIDDMRMIAAPPPPPMRAEQWPTLCDVTDALRRHHQPYIVLRGDVLVAVPAAARDALAGFLLQDPTAAG
jgi:hypothetical protein